MGGRAGHLRLTWNSASATWSWETIRNPSSLFLPKISPSHCLGAVRRQSPFFLSTFTWGVGPPQVQVEVKWHRFCSNQDVEGVFFLRKKKKNTFIFCISLAQFLEAWFFKKLVFNILWLWLHCWRMGLWHSSRCLLEGISFLDVLVLLTDYRIDISICDIRYKCFLLVCHLSFYIACGGLAWDFKIQWHVAYLIISPFLGFESWLEKHYSLPCSKNNSLFSSLVLV